MECRIDGKSAIVTGSSKGIGRGIAEELARSGADVTVTWHTDKVGAEETAQVIRDLGRKANIVQLDVSYDDQVEAMVASHVAAFGGLDIMVANAGGMLPGKLHEISNKDFDLIMRSNLYGPLFCLRYAARQMIAQGRGGRVITISSVHEEAQTPGSGAYCISKSGLRMLMRQAAAELGEHKITVNGIAPGMIVTPLNSNIMSDPELLKKHADMIVLREAGYPKDIAHMATFLASDMASYCTGGTYYVDGGWMLTWHPV